MLHSVRQDNVIVLLCYGTMLIVDTCEFLLPNIYYVLVPLLKRVTVL